MSSAELQRLVDSAAFFSAEHQAHLADLHGHDAWDVDLSTARLRFTAPSGAVREVGVQLIGTAAPGPRSWMWAWNNINGFPEATLRAAEAVRVHAGAEELSTATLPLTDELPYRLALAAKQITGSWVHYSGLAGGGTRVWMLVDHPAFTLAAPSVPRVLRAISEGLSGVTVADHRFALGCYGDARGMQLHDDGGVIRLDAGGGTVVVRFDGEGRIARLEATSAGDAHDGASQESPPPTAGRRRWFGRRG